MKKYLPLLVAAALLFSFSACKKKTEEEVTRRPLGEGPIMDTPTLSPHTGTGEKIEFEVVVPPDVEAGWSSVTLLIEDKELNKTDEITVPIGQDYAIPDSALSVKVAYFLPDFKMSGTVITSSSNNLNNPAVGLTVVEEGNQIFPESGTVGWLYEKFPSIHPFQHARYGLTLKEGVKK